MSVSRLPQEERRAAHLSVLMKVAQEALKAFDLQSLFNSTAEALREHFQYYDVAIFEVDENREELVLRAHSGAYELPSGYRQKVGVGIVGWVAKTGEPLCVGDVLSDPRYVMASEAETKTRSELAVPIKLAGSTVGVIDIQAPEVNGFDEEDVRLIKTVADQMAKAIEAIRQFQRAHMFRELNEQIIENFPESVAVVNESGMIVAANQKFCREVNLPKEEVIGSSLYDIVDQSLVESLNLRSAVERVLETGEPKHYLGVQHFSKRHPPRLLEIHILRLQAAGRRRIIFLVDDATERSRRVFKLEMLLQITQAIGETLELNRLLHAILKSLTAGPGLGFNRAILFLVNEDETEMEVAMAVGPATREEAYAIWARLAQEKWTLKQFIEDYPGEEGLWQTPFQQAVRGIKIPLADRNDILVQCLFSGEVQKLERPSQYHNLHPRLRELFGDVEIVCIPLVAKKKPLGIIIADNAFSGQPIASEEIEVLRLFATPAALAIDNARAYRQVQRQALQLEAALAELKSAQEKLIQSARLAAIGQTAAKVAHEIRNPLATIGGFARAILKAPNDIERAIRNARIIYEEVRKLEELLQEMLDFTSPKAPSLKWADLNELIRGVCAKYENQARDANVDLLLELSENLPMVMVDEKQFERALVNLIQNAFQALRGGGQVTIRTWCEDDCVKLAVTDNGYGIPPDALQHIFEPFFTTKPNGSGLGLAVVKRIVEDHNGQIEVSSQLGVGTTFVISLPLRRSEELETGEENE